MIYTEIEIKKFVYYPDISYINFICSFNDMNKILSWIKIRGFKSKYYEQIPVNIYELISQRIKVDGEVHALTLLPLQNDLSINKCFINDIKDYVGKKGIHNI